MRQGEGTKPYNKRKVEPAPGNNVTERLIVLGNITYIPLFI
jgi:hypothetical protein